MVPVKEPQLNDIRRISAPSSFSMKMQCIIAFMLTKASFEPLKFHTCYPKKKSTFPKKNALKMYRPGRKPRIAPKKTQS